MNLPLLISILAEQGILTPHQASRILGLEDAPPGTRMFAHYPSREWRIVPDGRAEVRDDGGPWSPCGATPEWLLSQGVLELTIPQPATTTRCFRFEDAEWRAHPGRLAEFRSVTYDDPNRWYQSSLALTDLLSDPSITETTPPPTP